MRYNVWYVFSNKQMKEEFLRNVVNHFGFMISEEQRNAEALMIKCKGSTVSLLYRTTVNPDYMTEDIINYKGEKCMCNCGEVNDRVNKDLDYPVQEYFNHSIKELEDYKNKKIKDAIKETEIYKSAKDFADKCKKNDISCSLDPYDMCNFGTVLPASSRKKIDVITKEFNESVDNLVNKCRIISNLLYQADTFEQRYEIMKTYGVLTK